MDPPDGDEEIKNLISLVDVNLNQLPGLAWLKESPAVALSYQSLLDDEVMVGKEPQLCTELLLFF